MNNINIIGRITHDLKVKEFNNGEHKLLNFSIAYTRKIKEKEETSFFDVIAWGFQAETIAKFFKKGDRIGINGRLKQDRFEDKDGNNRSKVHIVLNEFTFIEPKNTGWQKNEEKDADFSNFSDAPEDLEDVPF